MHISDDNVDVQLGMCLEQDMLSADFLVGVRVRSKNFPDGLLLGEVVLGCGPDGLGLPLTAGCHNTTDGSRRKRRRRRTI